METRSLKPYIVIILMMVALSIALAYTVDVRLEDEAGVNPVLPEQVGAWRGIDMLFCTSELCNREFQADQLTNTLVCPACGSPLTNRTIGENRLLPTDTVLVKKRYVDPEGNVLFANIVLSGRERASIHRPQICLTAAGNEIVKSTRLNVPMDHREPLDVMLLDLTRQGRQVDGKVFEVPSFYAYWFVGKDRETASHIQRMIWMGTDRVFRNVSHRWAYIGIGGMRQSWNDGYRERLESFIRDLYPLIVKKDPAVKEPS